MIIGDRLRELREEKKLSQGDIEKRTGLVRSNISRVANGHTVPAIETLEKFARALEVPMYQLFFEGKLGKLGDRRDVFPMLLCPWLCARNHTTLERVILLPQSLLRGV